MKAYLILEDGTVFTGTSIGSKKEIISEIVFNTSMTGYLEVLTDPSYAGQAVVMTYPLIGNYGICYEDMESAKPWPDGYIVRELSRMPSNFRCEGTIQEFLEQHDIPGIAGIDTRALTKILREKGTMNGMITTQEYTDLSEVLPRLAAYTTGKVVEKVTCKEKYVLHGDGPKVALLDLGAKRNIARSLNERGCELTVYPALTSAEEILGSNPDGIMLSNGPGDPKECTSIIEEIKKLYQSDVPIFAICLGHQLMALFTSTPSTLEIGIRALRWLSLGYICFSVTQVMQGYMRGAGETMLPMWISIINTVLLRMPLAYLLAFLTRSEAFPNGHPDALFSSLLITWITGMSMSLFVYLKGWWKRRLPEELREAL